MRGNPAVFSSLRWQVYGPYNCSRNIFCYFHNFLGFLPKELIISTALGRSWEIADMTERHDRAFSSPTPSLSLCMKLNRSGGKWLAAVGKVWQLIFSGLLLPGKGSVGQVGCPQFFWVSQILGEEIWTYVSPEDMPKWNSTCPWVGGQLMLWWINYGHDGEERCLWSNFEPEKSDLEEILEVILLC